MNTLVESMTGMNVMTDQVIAQDLLIAAKTGIKDYALAITETASPEVRTVLRRYLEEGIAFHEKLAGFMIQQGWYKAYDMIEHLKWVLSNSDTALQTANNR